MLRERMADMHTATAIYTERVMVAGRPEALPELSRLLLVVGRDDKRIVRLRFLQFQRLFGRPVQPHIDILGRYQHDRHGPVVDRLDNAIGFGRQDPIKPAQADIGLLDRAAVDRLFAPGWRMLDKE